MDDEDQLLSYGGSLLLEFGKVFRCLYTDQQAARASGQPNSDFEHENSKFDICVCLSILLASSQQAKTQAIEQNLFKKIVEICQENCEALHLSEL